MKSLCCTAKHFGALFGLCLTLFSGAALASSQQDIRPLLLLQDAERLLERKSAPAMMEKMWKESPSAWVREQAAAALAGHRARTRDWEGYKQVAGFAGPCASLLHSVYRKSPEATVRQWAAASLERDPARSAVCKEAQKVAAAAGFVSDAQVWRQIRVLVDERKSKQARRLLPLLKEDKASAGELNAAIQKATKRIRSKHKLATRASEELLAVSAVVAARRQPKLAGERWLAFESYIAGDINQQVWPMIGMWASREHSTAAALKYYRRSTLAALRPVELAWRVRAALREGDWSEVYETIDVMQGEQRELSAWLYWKAHALERLGQGAQADRLIDDLAQSHDDYYGLLAKAWSGRSLTSSRSSYPAAMRDSLAADADVRLAIALGEKGKTVEARRVWKHLFGRLSDQQLLALSDLAEKSGWLLGAINAADAARGTASNHSKRFPLPYLDTMQHYADKFEIDPAFVYAVARQESRFNPRARSSAGARGLMQVMPRTASIVARRHQYTRYHSSRLYRLDTNVIIGTRYIADLRERLGQDPVVLSASYNAGPTNVRKWLRRSKGVDKLVFVETIPFTETRLYVKHVMSNYAHYDLSFRAAGIKPWRRWLEGSYS